MFYIMSNNNGVVSVYQNMEFPTYESVSEKLTELKKANNELSAALFVCKRIEVPNKELEHDDFNEELLGFAPIVPNESVSAKMLIHFKSDKCKDHVPCIEVGTYSMDEDGEVKYRLEFGEQLVEDYQPISTMKIPEDHHFISIDKLDENKIFVKDQEIIGKPVLLKFEYGFVVSGMLTNENSIISYQLWDKCKLENDPVAYCPLPLVL